MSHFARQSLARCSYDYILNVIYMTNLPSGSLRPFLQHFLAASKNNQGGLLALLDPFIRQPWLANLTFLQATPPQGPT